MACGAIDCIRDLYSVVVVNIVAVVAITTSLGSLKKVHAFVKSVRRG